MNTQSLFIALEGLDGAGKSSVGHRLVELLDGETDEKRVLLTYEPHDPSCAGTFIRDVLTKKITEVSPRMLPLAFAANRLDHCTRVIGPWLRAGEKRLVITDRYYLSSLVYQSSQELPFEAVMQLNEKALKPDLFFFLNVSDEVCYERMKTRNQPTELFEDQLSHSRKKYAEAIAFLQKNGETIVEIDASGSINEVAQQILKTLKEHYPNVLS
jgi:thymidylate kinase